MRSFGRIKKYEYPHHRVLAKEKTNKLMMKFYSLARSCTRTQPVTPPHTAPVTARNTPVWARPHHIGTVLGPAKYRPKIPAFLGFFVLP